MPNALKGSEYISAHPEKYRKALGYLKSAGVFDAVSGVLIGKPMDNAYAEEYKEQLIRVINDPELPVVCNINTGHAMPRCIIPFGQDAVVDADKQTIHFIDQQKIPTDHK